MKQAILTFKNIRLCTGQIHKLRGYVGNVFSQYDLIHNHDVLTGKTFYRYPLIQFKLIDHTPCIMALTQRAVDIFTRIFMELDEIDIGGRIIPVNEKDFTLKDVPFGFSDQPHVYEFTSPWAGLNQNNFKTFTQLQTPEDKNHLLSRILTGNILSRAKYLGHRLSPDQRIETQVKLTPATITLKGKKMTGFKGIFKTNFILPDHCGLGKSVSRGFGTIANAF